MSNVSTNSVDRDVLREKERQARARALRGGRATGPGGSAGGGPGGPGGSMEEIRESTPKSFFPQLIKVEPSLEDETSRRIRNALGDFKEVQRYLVNDPKHLIGISSNASVAAAVAANNSSQGQHQRSFSKEPSSHHDDPKKGMANGQYKGSSSSGLGSGSMVNHRNNRPYHQSQPPKHTQQSQNSISGPSNVGSSNYQAQSSRKSGATAGKEAEPPPSKSHRKKTPYPNSSSSTLSNRVTSTSGTSSSSSLVNPSSSSVTPRDGRPPKMNNPSRPDSRRSNQQQLSSDHGSSSNQNRQNSSSSSSSRGTSNASYHNSHNGEIGSNSAQSSDGNVGRLPRIPKLPLLSSSDNQSLDPSSGSTVELETILQEMKQGVPPPLSAIETPRVEDSRFFFSPEPIPDEPAHNSSQSAANQNRNKNWTSRGRSGGRRTDKPTPTLKDDLDISESDDEGELSYKKMSHRISDYRSPSISRSFQYGSSHNQSSSQHYPLPRHVGGVPRSPPGTPPDSPPASPSDSSHGSIQGSPLQSLPGSAIHSPTGSPACSPVGPRSPPPPLCGGSIHSPADDIGRGSRSSSVASDSSNNSSSVSSEGEESSDEESDEKDVEDDRKDSDDHNDDLKDKRGKDKDFDSNTLDDRAGDGDDVVAQSGDDSAAKNWSLKNFMEKKNSPALPALATPGRSGLGFRSDRIGSDNTVASCDGKSDKSSLHLGHGGRYDLADHYSVSEILNPTPDIKEILRSPTPDIMDLDSMRLNQNNTTGPSDLMSPINSPETPITVTRREETMRIQSNNSESKRHSSYYNPTTGPSIRSPVSPCGKLNNDEEDVVQPTIRARTGNKTNKRKLHRRRSSSELSEGELDSDSDKKSVSPKRSSSSSSSCSSDDENEKTVTTTVPISRKNNSSADSRKPRQFMGKKEVGKIGQKKESTKVNHAEEKVKSKRTTNPRRSVSPDAKSSSKMKPMKKEKVKKITVKEEPRKPTKMPGRPPGSGKVASKTVATSKKPFSDKNDKSRKGKTANFPSKEYVETSSSSDSSANSASDGESAPSNSDEEEEDGVVRGVVGRSPRIKPVATVAPLPPFAPPGKKSRMDSPVNSLKPPPVKPIPVKAVVAPITLPEINKEFNVPIKRSTPGRPPGKTKSSKDKMERALVARKKMPVEVKEELDVSQVLSSPISDHTEYKENILPDCLMVRINISLLERVPPYPPLSRSSLPKAIDDRSHFEQKTNDNGSRSSKSRELPQNCTAQKESVDIVKRDSSKESVSRIKETKDVVKKKNLPVEAASRPSKCRTPPPLKRKIKDEKQEVPYAKRLKVKQEKPDERTNIDEDLRFENLTPKMERSDSVNSLASLTSQHGSQRSSTPTCLKRNPKKDKRENKEFPLEAASKSVPVPRAGAITPSESKKPSVPFKKELSSNVASVVSEKEARKREKEEKRKHRNRSKEKPETNLGVCNKTNKSESRVSNKDPERIDIDKVKTKRIKPSPKHEPEEGFHVTNSKVTKESSKGEKKSCDKGLNDNTNNTTQYHLDYEPRDDRPSDYYLSEAKRLKHQADKESNRTLQVMKYLEAILYFILTGNAMEEAHVDKDKVYTMFKETLHLIKSISSKFQKNQSSSTGSTDNKLAVLSLRCQSRLFFKLFAIRKAEMKEFQRKISEFQKSQAGKLATQLSLAAGSSLPNQVLNTGHQLKSPCQPARGISGIGTNGVPSPHSPTPSPAGSVASVGSQSSGYTSSSNELNGAQGRHTMPNNGGSSGHAHHGLIAPPGNINHQSVSTGLVSIPAIIYSMIQRQQSHFSNLQQCHDLWEQGDYLIEYCHAKEFFDRLDEDCGKLTIHSTISQLVHYIHQGLKCLKDSDT